jgi:hypothetical protein
MRETTEHAVNVRTNASPVFNRGRVVNLRVWCGDYRIDVCHGGVVGGVGCFFWGCQFGFVPPKTRLVLLH